MASPGEREVGWKSRLGLVTQSSGSESRAKGWDITVSCPGCRCQERGGSGIGLMPKETIQMDRKWDSDVAGIVGEL